MDKKGIEEVLQIYFDASYESDSAKMDRVFRPEAHIYGINEGGETLADFPKEQFVKLVGRAPKEPAPNHPRQDEIHFIEFSSDTTAVAKVSLTMSGTHFTDLLTFVYLDGEWRVIAKMFYGKPLEK